MSEHTKIMQSGMQAVPSYLMVKGDA